MIQKCEIYCSVKEAYPALAEPDDHGLRIIGNKTEEGKVGAHE